MVTYFKIQPASCNIIICSCVPIKYCFILTVYLCHCILLLKIEVIEVEGDITTMLQIGNIIRRHINQSKLLLGAKRFLGNVSTTTCCIALHCNWGFNVSFTCYVIL